MIKLKKELLKKIIEKKEKKIEFAIVTNLENGEGCIFEKDKPLDKNFKKIHSFKKAYGFNIFNDGVERTDYTIHNLYEVI